MLFKIELFHLNKCPPVEEALHKDKKKTLLDEVVIISCPDYLSPLKQLEDSQPSEARKYNTYLQRDPGKPLRSK